MSKKADEVSRNDVREFIKLVFLDNEKLCEIIPVSCAYDNAYFRQIEARETGKFMEWSECFQAAKNHFFRIGLIVDENYHLYCCQDVCGTCGRIIYFTHAQSGKISTLCAHKHQRSNISFKMSPVLATT